MNNLLSNLANLKNNPHLGIPTALIIACGIAAIWLPKYKDQLEGTSKLLTVYLGLAAASSGPSSTSTPQSKTP